MEGPNNRAIALSNYLTQTLSPDINVRRPAEQSLKNAESEQDFPELLLKIIAENSFDLTIRICAAVNFKNYIKSNWAVDQDTADDKINEQTRACIKRYIIDLMLESGEAIQKQLSDAVSIIGKYDFPDKWSGLLEQMIQKFSTGNFSIINGALRTAHSLFKKYRYEFKSQKLWTEIKFVLNTFAEPLTKLFVLTMQTAETQSTDLPIIYNSLLFIMKIFYSLNFQDLPEFFEDNMATWMNNFQVLLTKNVPVLQSDDEEEASVMEQIRSQICENLIMYATKYDEEFTSYLRSFVDTIWNLLTSLGPQQKYDLLVTNGLNFLSTVADRAQYQNLFENPEVLKSICERVVFPNIEFRTCDEEMFEDNPDEYIRRDIEGSDVDTRRKAACDLIKVLAKFLEPQIKTVFLTYVQTMLRDYTQNRNWKSKNAAIYLVTSLESRGQTQKFGVTKTSNIINLSEFAVEHVISELQKPDVNDLPVIKADCIRYLMTFRSVLPSQLVVNSLPLVSNHLACNSKVVHSYAAVCLEKILLIKNQQTQKPLVDNNTLSTIAEPILTNLFAVLRKPGSEENDYIMKAILRTLAVLNDKAIPLLGNVLENLTSKLKIVAKNPSNPNFNHALFESIALSIKIVCTNMRQPEVIANFDEALFPVVEIIIRQDVSEFFPYIFQLLSMLLEFRNKGDPIPLPYWELYQYLLNPPLWEKTGIIHPLVRLITAYITRVNPAEMSNKINLMAILGVFQLLIANKANDHEGLHLLRMLIENCPNEIMVPNIKQIFSLLFQRLTLKKTDKFVKGMAAFLCFYIINHNPIDMINMVNSLQPNLFRMTVERVLLNEVALNATTVDKKIIIVGLTKLLTEVPDLIDGDNSNLWPSILKQILKAASSTEISVPKLEDIDLEELAKSGYEVAYSKLAYASKPEYDPLLGIGDVVPYFCRNLSTLSQRHPGRLAGIISSNLTLEEQQLLQGYLNAAGVQI